METTEIDRWLAGYLEAWRADDRGRIEALFAEDADYLTAPYRPPMSRAELVEYWLGEEESGIPWTFEHEVLAREGDLYVVRGVTHYPRREDGAVEAVVYHNLWLITLDGSGRAQRFVEYFMAEERDEQES